MATIKTYYKATRKDGVFATRGSTMKFSHAIVHNGSSDSSGSNWFGRPDLAAKTTIKGEMCEAVEITVSEYKALKAGATGYSKVMAANRKAYSREHAAKA